MPQSQPVNSSQTDGLSSQFQRRWEAGFSWTSACSAVQLLPGLRGFWPMSGFDSGGDATDMGGLDHHLAYNGNPTYNRAGHAPYIDLDGTGDFLSHIDHADLDIVGTETYVAAPIRGLTMGGWFWVDVFGALDGYMSKGTTAPAANLAYSMFQNGGAPTTTRMEVYAGGVTTSVDSTVTLAVSTWYFLVARYLPSVPSMSIYVNTTATHQLAGVPAAINNVAGPFEIGRFLNANDMDGRASLCFLCATALSNGQILSLFHKTKALYGVK